MEDRLEMRLEAWRSVGEDSSVMVVPLRRKK